MLIPAGTALCLKLAPTSGATSTNHVTHEFHRPKLARMQWQLAKKVKFSANWRKIKTNIGRLHATIARCRRDILHKLSNYLSKSHAMIVFEELRVKNMSASAKGTVESPGRNVKQKSGLNRVILEQGWGMLVDFSRYKQQWKQGDVLLDWSQPKVTASAAPAVAMFTRTTG